MKTRIIAAPLAHAQPTPRYESFADQLLYQRAFEAVLWAMPAADTLVMRRAQGPETALLNRTWVANDIEKIK